MTVETSSAITIGDNLENWMSLLPATVQNTPIIYLAIPGSHDSASYSITQSSGIAPDALPFVRRLAKVFGPLVRRFVFNWSVTQHASVEEQLHSGVRYLDIRLGTKTGSRDLYFVHGLYGMEVEKILQEVDAFLADHEGEIIILDFQHFYSFTKENHSYLMTVIDSHFGSRMCPTSRSLTHITLHWMKEKGYQVIVIYRDNAAAGVPVYWPSNKWPTPWPETTSISTMIAFLEEKIALRPMDTGFVTQCVLTPDVKFFLKHSFSSLEEKCGKSCNKAIIPWLQKQQPGPKGVNIVMSDFIKMENIPFCKTVIQLNASLLQKVKIQKGMGREKTLGD